MSNILITADIHAHEFEEFGVATEFGYNTRFRWILKVFDEMAIQAEKNNCDSIVILGDLFHSRKTITTIVYVEVYKKLLMLAEKYKVYILVGNHDCSLKDSHHGLSPFNNIKNVCIMDTAEQMDINGVSCYWVPYIENQKDLQQVIDAAPPCDIMFGHFSLYTSVAPKVLCPLKDGVDLREQKKFGHCFFGHFHNVQQVFDNGYYVGAPIMHNFGDSEDPKCFGLYKTEEKEFAFIDISDKTPKFVKFELTDENESSYETKLKEVLRDIDYLELKDFRTRKRNIQLPSNVRLLEQETVSETKRIDIEGDSSIQTIMQKYLDNTVTDLDKILLLNIGRELVNG